MTAEGIFPKINGDILYASEANRFALAGKFITVGSTATVASGTAAAVLGSVVIAPSTISNPVTYTIDMATRSNPRDDILLRISGTSGFMTLQAGSGMGAGSPIIFSRISLGSVAGGFVNTGFMQAFIPSANNDGNPTANTRFSTKLAQGPNGTGSVVIFFENSAPSDTTQILRYQICSFGGNPQ